MNINMLMQQAQRMQKEVENNIKKVKCMQKRVVV